MTAEPSLERLIRPRRVAIVGASADFSKAAGKPLVYLRRHGFGGEVYAINPRYEAIDGVRCYPSVADLPEAPDVGLVLLGTSGAIQAVKELAMRGTPAAIVLGGGYAEIDASGALRQEDLRAAAGAMRLLGPNTIGVVNVAERIALSASSALELDRIPAGHVAVVSQSGGMLGALLSRCAAHGLGLSSLVATGNEADVDVCDVVEYLLDDPTTRVIALYLESVRRPRRFREIASEAARRGKPLVVFKVGRSEAGALSATSHTGALAGADRMYDALFLQTGAMRVNAMTELIDVSAALVVGKQLRGTRLAILTSTGGGGAVVADAAGAHGFWVPPPDGPTVQRLRAVLTGEAAATDRNPIDLTLANLRSETYRGTLAALVDSPTYDALVVVVGSSGLGDPSLAAEPVRVAAAESSKPVLVYVNPHALNIVSYLNGVGVAAFATAEGCAAGLLALRRWARPPDLPTAEAATPGDGAYVRGCSGQLDEPESLELFERFGIPRVRQRIVASAEDAKLVARELGTIVVVKVVCRVVAHKSDVGGVRVGVRAEDVEAVCRELHSAVLTARPDAHISGYLIQEQIIGGTEYLLGVVRDPQLGLAVVLGAGGVATEVFDDTALRLLPLRSNDPEEMVQSLRSRVLLEGFRGRPRGDISALYRTIRRFGALAETFGDRLIEAEINPLFVLPVGQGVKAADGLVVLQP